jgi:hypothetical protein
MLASAQQLGREWRQYGMRNTLAAVLVALAGWMNPARAELFSSTGPVIAILAGDLFLGEAKGHLDGSGTVRIQSRANPEVSCYGQFASSAEHGGAGSMRCSDGATLTFRFQRLGFKRGHGTGVSTRGPLSFTYGLSASESEPYLKPPP